MEFRTEFIPNVPVLYFISDTQGHAKVGIASDIKNRFTTLQVGSAYELKIIHLEYRDTYKEVQELEREYHSILSEFRVRGEWYEEKAVIDCLCGKLERKDYMCNVCKDFRFEDLLTFWLIGLTAKNEEDFIKQYEEKMPKYWKDWEREKVFNKKTKKWESRGV